MRRNASGSSFSIHPSAFRSAFTLVELLVVIGIIAILIGILIPTVGKIQTAGRESSTRALITQIDGACQAYYSDFRAYPGPLSNHVLARVNQTVRNRQGAEDSIVSGKTGGTPLNDGSSSTFTGTSGGATTPRVTGSENLVLGLMGGLTYNTATNRYHFISENIGNGPLSFNPARPAKSTAYIQPITGAMSQGKFSDDAASLNPSKDSDIPEFIDKWPSGMPILYMRARVGGATSPANAANPTEADNNVVIDQVDEAADRSQYNLQEVACYTQSSIGVGRTIKESQYKGGTYNPKYPHGLAQVVALTLAPNTPVLKSAGAATRYPYDGYSYLTDPSSDSASLPQAERMRQHQPRKKDSYILISAGRDRVYGTEDDLTNFGAVMP